MLITEIWTTSIYCYDDINRQLRRENCPALLFHLHSDIEIKAPVPQCPGSDLVIGIKVQAFECARMSLSKRTSSAVETLAHKCGSCEEFAVADPSRDRLSISLDRDSITVTFFSLQVQDSGVYIFETEYTLENRKIVGAGFGTFPIDVIMKKPGQKLANYVLQSTNLVSSHITYQHENEVSDQFPIKCQHHPQECHYKEDHEIDIQDLGFSGPIMISGSWALHELFVSCLWAACKWFMIASWAVRQWFVDLSGSLLCLLVCVLLDERWELFIFIGNQLKASFVWSPRLPY